MKAETLSYFCKDVPCLGYLAYNPNLTAKAPAIIVAPAYYGLDDFAKTKANELATAGYIALAADIYGKGKIANTSQEAEELMTPFFFDRALLRERILSAYNAVKNLSQVDEKRIGAIGFCFGGLTVVELLRSGADIRGVVSFHGVLSDHLGGKKARLAPNATKILGALLVLHGAKDPMVSPQDIQILMDEMSQAEVNWEVDTYGSAAHAFTNPQAHDVKNGLYYEQTTATRSFNAMHRFFEEIF